MMLVLIVVFDIVQEMAGEAKGKANEMAGQAQGKKEEVKSKM